MHANMTESLALLMLVGLYFWLYCIILAADLWQDVGKRKFSSIAIPDACISRSCAISQRNRNTKQGAAYLSMRPHGVHQSILISVFVGDLDFGVFILTLECENMCMYTPPAQM